MPTALKENAKYLLSISFLLFLFTLITFNFQNISFGKRVLGASTIRATNLEKEKDYWLAFLRDYPSYFDGWVELAVLEYEAGNFDQANEYYLKAKTIAPNSQNLPW